MRGKGSVVGGVRVGGEGYGKEQKKIGLYGSRKKNGTRAYNKNITHFCYPIKVILMFINEKELWDFLYVCMLYTSLGGREGKKVGL